MKMTETNTFPTRYGGEEREAEQVAEPHPRAVQQQRQPQRKRDLEAMNSDGVDDRVRDGDPEQVVRQEEPVVPQPDEAAACAGPTYL